MHLWIDQLITQSIDFLFWLYFSEEISSARELETEIITAALEEIDSFCEDHSWLADIHRFARKWNKDAVLQWKRAQAYSIEVGQACSIVYIYDKMCSFETIV